MADKHIKEYMSSLYSAYEHCRKATKEALDDLSAHSTACYAIVIVINAAAMLLKATLEIEFCYHFRPYHWKIMNLSAYITSLGLMFIGRGTLFIYSVISLALRVIWQYLLLACYGLVKFMVMLIAHLTSAVVYMVSFVLNTALLVISGVVRVSRFHITPLLSKIPNLVRNYSKSLTFSVIIAIVVVSLSTLVWRRYKREKLNRTDNVRGDSDVKADEEPAASLRDQLTARLTDSEFSFEAGGRTNSPVTCDTLMSDHTYAVICPESPLDECTMGRDCKNEHCPMPYQWKFREPGSKQWTSFSLHANVIIEKRYCNVENVEVELAVRDGLSAYSSASINFDDMTMKYGSVQVALRRLSTPSYIQEPGKALATKWIWYWKDNDGWKKYAEQQIPSKIMQEEIEAAYLKQDKEYSFRIGQFKYRLIFSKKSMYQKNLDQRYFTRRCVRRRPLFIAQSELQLQKSVSSCGDLLSSIAHTIIKHQENGDFKRIPLSPGCKEFQTVKEQFHTTIPPGNAQILRIEKIENDILLDRYNRKRDRMKKKLNATNYDKIERQLFHGTSSDVIDAICKQNFDHRVHGKNGTKYGEGSYFAVNASYSNCYSSGEETRFMFLVSVLTGDYKLGNQNLRRPPLKEPNNPASDLYDSCVDNEGQPNIFVIFNDEQCYPSYLITYSVKSV